MGNCRTCGAALGLGGTRGRLPVYCSTRCRVAAHRASRRLPAELTERRAWCRRMGKRPVMIDGSQASSTNPKTWTDYRHTAAARIGDGLGIMLGDGLGCWDLDHCLRGDELADWARAVIDRAESPVWVERSLSGTGLHVFVNAAEAPGFRRGEVEFYSRARFIAVTGDRYVLRSGSNPYRRIRGGCAF